MLKAHHCVGCNNYFASTQSLWNHKQRCDNLKSEGGMLGKKPRSLDQKIKTGTKTAQKTYEKEKSVLNHLLKSYLPAKEPTVFLPSTVDGLYDKLGVLIGELEAGNTKVTPIIITIIKKLKEKGALNRNEKKKVCTQDSETTNSDSETDQSTMDEETDESEMEEEDTSSQDGDYNGNEKSTKEDEKFDHLILNVADALVRNEKKNLMHALLAVKSNDRRKIESWIEGEESLEQTLPSLKDDVDMMKIKILMKEIDEKREKVDKVLRALRNVTDYGKLKDVLHVLKNQEVITDGEYKRLMIANHDLQSYINAFQGMGIWI